MQAATVELLKREGQFQISQAVAIAEAIDMAFADAQPVTVPILDARILASEAKFEARFNAFESKVDARFNAFKAEFDARFTVFEARFDAFEAKIDRKFERFRLQLFIAVAIGYAATGPIGTALLEAIRRAF
jgi:hypothetical protein